MNPTIVNKARIENPSRRVFVGLGLVFGGIVALGGTGGVLRLLGGSARKKLSFFKTKAPRSNSINKDSIYFPRDEVVRKNVVDSRRGLLS